MRTLKTIEKKLNSEIEKSNEILKKMIISKDSIYDEKLSIEYEKCLERIFTLKWVMGKLEKL